MDDDFEGHSLAPRLPRAARPGGQRPPAAELAVPRPRLVAQLRRRLSESAVWLHGGAGWGKSFIAAELMRQWAGPAAWWRPAEAECTDTGLEQSLAAACAQIAKVRPASLLPRPETMREVLCRVQPGALLVVDGAERMLRHGCSGFLCALIEECPTTLYLVITSREALPASLVRLTATGALTVLSPPSIAFDEAESLAAARRMGLEDDALVARLHADAEGWPAALALMVRRVLAGSACDPRSEAAAACLDYVDAEVLDAAQPADVASLARLDHRGWLDETRVLQAPGARAALRALEGLHAAGGAARRWQRCDAGGLEPVYRLHPLVAMALDRRGRITTAAHAGEAAPRISLQVMGGFTIRVDGTPVRFTRKAPTRLLALLKCLIALGGRGVHVERIAGAVWPEAEGDAAMRSFTSALHRLRRLLGLEGALRLSGSRLSLDESLCQLDLWSLEEAFERIDTDRCGEVSGDTEGVLGCAEALLAAYRGPFLTEETDYPEFVATRERLRGRFLRHVVRLADALERLGLPREAAEVCRRATEVEPAAMPLQDWLARRRSGNGGLPPVSGPGEGSRGPRPLS